MPGLQQELIFAQSPEAPCRLLMPQAIAETLNRFRQLRVRDLEAGGILLGVRRGPHLEIVEATGPMRGDRRTRTEFVRRDPGHFQLAQRHWRSSRGTVGYVGEWHTHPEPWPSPSGIDIAQWHRIVDEEHRPTAFVIVGTQGWFVARGLRERGCLAGTEPWTTLLCLSA